MKSLIIVAFILQLASAIPHGPDKSTPKVPGGSNSSQPTIPKSPALAPASSNRTSPAGCRILPGDQKWPTDAEWKAALPGVIKRGEQKQDATRPDYHLSARSPADVQRAVNFASKHDIRLSVITTGHDFLSRCVRWRGLS
jgi:hypothetical protein